MVLTIYVVYRLVNSRFGRALRAVRDDYVAAQMSGVNVARTRLIAFTISAFFAGIAGGLLGHLLENPHPRPVFLQRGLHRRRHDDFRRDGQHYRQRDRRRRHDHLPQFIIPFERGGTFFGYELPALNGLTQIVIALILIFVMLVRPEGIAGGKEFSFREMIARVRRPMERFRASGSEVEIETQNETTGGANA